MFDNDDLIQQIEELKLISCSLLPEEEFSFISSDIDENNIWTDLMHDVKSLADVSNACHPHLCQASFRLKVIGCRICFDVTFPTSYNGMDISDVRHAPVIAVQGENMSRTEQEMWNGIVRETLAEIGATESIDLLILHSLYVFMKELIHRYRYPTYQLLAHHLLPLLHEEASKIKATTSPSQRQSRKNKSQLHHALLISHHLISPNKRRSLQQWSSSLSISGFAKVGYPGVIYGQGDEEDILEFVENIKAMTWLALKVRFVEPVPPGRIAPDSIQWLEFQKVGEVVAEMRRLGREDFILEMGIGSAGTKN